jgi:hypothetical protein
LIMLPTPCLFNLAARDLAECPLWFPRFLASHQGHLSSFGFIGPSFPEVSLRGSQFPIFVQLQLRIGGILNSRLDT